MLKRTLGRAAGRARRVRRRIQVRRIERRMAGPRLLQAFAGEHPDAFFVEVGSNDGLQHDHLRPFILRHGWHGIMVEPVPYVFERLRGNYGDRPGVVLENAAIADRDGELPFFHLVPPDEADLPHLPDWYDGIGSFSRETLARHAASIPDVERRIVETRVQSLTLETLLARHGDPQLDLLAVDTEGYDYEILKTVDFERRRPRLVVYEHFHLVRRDRDAARALLEAAGYTVLEEGFDTWAVLPHPDDGLTHALRRATPAVRGVSAEEDERRA